MKKNYFFNQIFNKLVVATLILFTCGSGYSQNFIENERPSSAQEPYASFSQDKGGIFEKFTKDDEVKITPEHFKYNSGRWQSHPEFGKVYKNLPEGSVEILEKRTANYKEFLTPEGNAYEVSIGEMHYLDNNGFWRSKDFRLKPQNDYWIAEHQNVPLLLNTKGEGHFLYKNGDVIKIGIDAKVGEKPINIKNNYTVGDEGMYISNARQGIDRKVKFNESEIETDFIIHQLPSGSSGSFYTFSEKIELPEGYKFNYPEKRGHKTSNGNWIGEIDIVNKNGEITLTIKPAVCWDNSRNHETNYIGEYQIEMISNGVYEIKIMVASSWLQSPNRQFPITIDPTYVSGYTAGSGSCYVPNGWILGPTSVSLNLPGCEVITGITYEFNYSALNGARLNQGRITAAMTNNAAFTRCGVVSNAPFSFLDGSCTSDEFFRFINSNTSGSGTVSTGVMQTPPNICSRTECGGTTLDLHMYVGRTNITAGCGTSPSFCCTGLINLNPNTARFTVTTVAAAPLTMTELSAGGSTCGPYSENITVTLNGGCSSCPEATITSECGGGTGLANVQTGNSTQSTFTRQNNRTPTACGVNTCTWSATAQTDCNAQVSSGPRTRTVYDTFTQTPNATDQCSATVQLISVTSGAACFTATATSVAPPPTCVAQTGPSDSQTLSGTMYAGTPCQFAYNRTATATGCPTAALPTVTPTFNPVGPLCQNSTPPVLPTTSTNGISGDWNAPVNTSTAVTTTYTFTPNDGSCSTTATLDITVRPTHNTSANFTTCTPGQEGVVVQNLTNQFGCDSIHTITTTLLPSSTGNVTHNGCQGDGFSVVVNGNTYNQANPVGSETLIAANGCDSVVAINLTFLPNSTGNVTYNGCEGDGFSVVVNGNTYNEANPIGSETLSAANGCDSVVAVNLVFLPNTTGNINHNGCEGDGFSVIVGGTTYNEGNPTGNETLIAANGCDSVVTINLQFFPNNTTFANSTSCNPADTGVFVSNLINQFGCDSTHTLTVGFLDSDSTFENLTSCLPADTGVFVSNDINQFGCDSSHTVTITLLPSDITFDNQTSCNPADTGVFVSNLINQFGCDSTHTLTVSLLPSDSTFENLSSCLPADTGVFITNDINQFGCDSSHTVTVVLLPSDTTFDNSTSCLPADTGVFISNLTNQFGCDSVHTFTVTLLPSDTTFTNSTSCNPADTGVFVSNLINQFGCDSTHTLTVGFLDSDSTFENLTSCLPADTGVFINNGINQFGCDSSHTVTITLLPSDITFDNQTSCNPADTGVFVSNLINQFGCDSTHTLTVSLLPSDSTFENLSSCLPADTGVFITNDINQFGCDSSHTITVVLLPSDTTFDNSTSCLPADTGVFISNLTNQFGCDSVHTFTVTLLPSDTTFTNSTSCNPADTGVFVSNLINQFGCDSTHTLTVGFLDSDSTFENLTSCLPADTGVFVSNDINQFGCDSVHTLTVTLLPSDTTFENLTSCNPADTGVFVSNLINQFGCDSTHTRTVDLLLSDSTFVNSTSCLPSDTGVFVSNDLNQFGCDSVHTLTITLLPSDTTFENLTSCNPADTGIFVFNEINQFGCDSTHTRTIDLLLSDSTFVNSTSCLPADTGVFVSNDINQFGCDSVHTLTITLLPSDTTFENSTSCNPADTGVFVNNLVNQFGCDSTHTRTVTLLPSDLTFDNQTSCNPADTGTVVNNFINQFGCDSTHTVTVAYLESDSTFENLTSCLPADTGVFVTNGINQFGCDSVHTIITTLITGGSSVENITACDSVQISGNWYFTSTSFDETLSGGSANGCDSVVTYNLTINQSSTTNISEEICDGDVVTIGGQDFTATGNYQITIPNVSNCDSVINLSLNVIPATDPAPAGSSFNTGTNGSGGTLPGGSNDLLWQVSRDNINGPYNPAVVMSSVPANYFNSPWPDAAWISHQADGSHVVNEDFFYMAQFELACADECGGSYSDPNTLCLNLDFYADNSVLEIYINGVAQSPNIPDIPVANPYFHGGFQAANVVSVSLCENWQPGLNTILVQVVSGPGFAGFLAQTSINPPPTSTDTISATICDGDAFNFNNIDFTTAGTYTETLTNSFGCDSLVTLILEVNDVDTTSEDLTSCDPADEGVVVLNLSNQFGCDSTHTITTTLLPSSNTFENLTTCDPAQEGTVVLNLTNQFGCDSTHTIITDLLPSDNTQENLTSCNPADVGTVVLNLTNQHGCDSIHTITTTLLPSNNTQESVSSCDPTDVGTVVLNLTNQFGCDSTHTVNTTLSPSSNTSANATSCDPADVGTVVLNLTNQFGCDSTHTITTTLLESNTTTENVSSCNPDDTGTVVLNLTNQFGCDSTHTINTSLLRSDSDTINNFTCFANEAGVSSTVFTNEFGCDSVITTVTTLLSNEYSVFPDYVAIRAGESVDFIINNEDDNLEFSWVSTDGQTCNPPCQNYLVTATEAVTNYYFTFVDTSSGCINNDTLRVDLEYFSELNVPNIFTPNNDGQNDVYRAYGEDLFDYSMMIFDRWGGKLFETNDINQGWDGNFKGKPVASGVYMVIIQATGLDTKKYEITQNFKLVR